MSGDQDDAAEYELVMPFVLCVSEGGPFDDQAFVAGYQCGSLNAELAVCADMPQGPAIPAPRLVHTEILPQLDLIAMRYGFTVDSEGEDESPDWSRVTFAVGES